MAKKTKKTAKKEEVKVEDGGQMDLIDVQPANAKQIVKEARFYKKLQLVRLAALDREIAQKIVVRGLIKESNLQPLEGGKIQFKCEGVEICVTPRDELVTVKEEDE